MKENIATGILAMPDAFKNAGLVVGTIGTIVMGIMCTHCMHMLVRFCYSDVMNGNLGFKIETYFALIARDLLTSLASQQSQHSTKCVQFVLLHINYQVVKTLMYVKMGISTLHYVMKH